MGKKRSSNFSRGFGLIAIIISAVIIILAASGALYLNNQSERRSTTEVGIDAIEEAEELKNIIEERQEQSIPESSQTIDPQPAPQPAPEPQVVPEPAPQPPPLPEPAPEPEPVPAPQPAPAPEPEPEPEPEPAPEPQPAPAPPPPPPPPPPSSDDPNTVIYEKSGYSPSPLTVKVGTTVTFKNQSSTGMWTASNIHPSHTLYPQSSIGKCGTSDEDIIFDSCGTTQPGGEWSFTFIEVGTWGYHNHLRAGHTGAINVTN